MIATKSPTSATDSEIGAIGIVYGALKELEPAAQRRVLNYVSGKLGLEAGTESKTGSTSNTDSNNGAEEEEAKNTEKTQAASEPSDGINAVAQRWMMRNGFTAPQLSKVFSIGGDEIDLITKEIPGKGKRARMRSVILLKGVAAYLAGGTARVSHQAVKETCLHYDAFDSANFAANLKTMSAEVTGTKQAGYTLTPRGLVGATDLLKELLTAEPQG